MENMMVQNNISRAQLVMETPEGAASSWQLSMLLFNEPDGLLPVSECFEGETRRCYYDVTGASPLSAIMIRSSFDCAMITDLIEDLCGALGQVDEYLLDGGKLLLEPDYIFYKREHCSFCYRPFAESDFDRQFARLAEFITERVDTEDSEAFRLAGRLYHLALEKNADAVTLREALETDSGDPEIPEQAGGTQPEETHPDGGFDPSEEPIAPSGWTEEDLADIDELFPPGPRQFTVYEPEKPDGRKKAGKRGRRKKRKNTSAWGDWSQFNRENP